MLCLPHGPVARTRAELPGRRARLNATHTLRIGDDRANGYEIAGFTRTDCGVSLESSKCPGAHPGCGRSECASAHGNCSIELRCHAGLFCFVHEQTYMFDVREDRSVGMC